MDSFYNLSTTGFTFILLAVTLLLCLPRKYVFIPIILTVCYLTLGQQIIIFVFHFTAIRLIILTGWLRLLIRHEIILLKLNTIDKVFIVWVVSSFIISNIQWQTSEMLINKLGFVFNAVGIYFLFRFIIRDLEEIKNAIAITAVIILPLAIIMIYEYEFGRNIFSVFGGVPETNLIRGERFRCQGPFRHPILAGTFGATLFPLFLALWFQEKNSKITALLGLISSTVITMTSVSIGPLLAYMFGLAGVLMWPCRNYMRQIRWGILICLITLHFIMKAPVWYLMSRIGELFGGGGWHRSFLIDQAISHVDQWWLIGTKNTAEWLPYSLEINTESADITNQYISEGITGGAITLILFVLIIVYCFKVIGLTIKKMKDNPFPNNILIWSLGASMLAHTVAFLSVSYFDQIIVIWYLTLAMISTIGSIKLKDNA